MKTLKLYAVLLFSCNIAFGQYNLTKQQQYLINEWQDALGGQIYYAYNYPKTYEIYKQLKTYSGMDFPIIFGQTNNWGQAHYGGLIIIDYSTINKDKNILAFVFSHEWGHQALGHLPNFYNPDGDIWKFRNSPSEKEDEADEYAGKFLAQMGYNINTVYNYLSSLPETGDNSYSSVTERAKTVKRGYYSTSKNTVPAEDLYETILVPCTHLMHPGGDLVPCSHYLHPGGDIIQCSHMCQDVYYRTFPCHPNGDIVQCSHFVHYNGDLIPCNHLQHPNGDTKRVKKY